MKVRFGLVLTISLAVVAGACATAGAGGGEGGAQPRNNQYTNEATLYIQQAQQAESDSVADNRYRQALDAAMDGIEADSTNPQSYYQAGFALVMLDENYDRADSYLSRATELYPAYEEQVRPVREQAWVNLYNAAIDPLNQGSVEDAIQLFERANEMYGGRPEAYLNLGASYARIGETEQSAEAFRQALEVIREQAAQMEQADSVSPQQRESVMRNEQMAMQNLGRQLTQLGRSQEAIQVYSDYLQRHPDDIQALSNLAVALNQAQMADSAQAIYQNLLSRQNLETQDLVTVGVGLYQAEQFDRSAEAFGRALEMSPRSRDAAYNLAQSYFADENWEEAVDAARDVLELDPRNGNVYKLLARSLAESGNQQEGGRVLEEYQALNFEVQSLQFTPSGTGGATVAGVLTNRSVGQGEPIVLRFHFLGGDGTEVGTEEQTIPAPGQNETTRFEASFSAEEIPEGYWYEVVRPQQ